MNYLVTGGAGFIGSHIVEGLVNKKESVVVIDNLSFGKLENIEGFKDKVRFVEGDIKDIGLLKKEFEGQDFIIHLAALRSVPGSFKNSQEYYDVNVNGTLNVLTAAKESNVKKVILASSSSVYGDSKVFPQKEDSLLNPTSPYAKSKLEAEKLCMDFTENGLKCLILRYFNVFGPGQDPSSEYAAVIPKFITSLLNGIKPVIYGDGNQSRDLIFVKDVSYATIMACRGDIGGEIINIGSGETRTVNQLLEGINIILGKDVKARFEEERLGDFKHTLADISKQRELLKFELRYDFDSGLKETIEWFKLLNLKDSISLENGDFQNNARN